MLFSRTRNRRAIAAPQWAERLALGALCLVAGALVTFAPQAIAESIFGADSAIADNMQGAIFSLWIGAAMLAKLDSRQ
jgi:hypothetical protein